MKTASFTVRADARQSARWKQAAQAEGHPNAGSWLAAAADAYLKVRATAGQPVALAWQRGASLWVRLVDGREEHVTGWTSPPFGVFRGNQKGPGAEGCKLYTLVYLPDRRMLATLRNFAECKALASDLARAWVRWGGEIPAEDLAPIIQRLQR